MTRREVVLGMAAMMGMPNAMAHGPEKPAFETRGVILTPDDLTLQEWPDLAKAAGLTTIALHPFVAPVRQFIGSDSGPAFLGACRKLGLQVEYELHAMSELLPRRLFDQNPAYFRMEETGKRSKSSNLCVSCRPALDIAAENAIEIARSLKPTTNRYFYWGDDGAPWCKCPECRRLSDSDQALVLENHVVRALRRVHPGAKLAHLAYANTLPSPRSIRPSPGIFLEFAPINRRYDVSIGRPANREHLDALDANLRVFGVKDAQVLEYWLDVSRFSKWTKPAVKLPWNAKVVQEDLEVYAARGIRHVTSFGVYIDKDYVDRFGEPPINEYGRLLRGR